MNGIIFPGQGSQYTGMGKSLYDNFSSAKELFSYIDKCAGFNLSSVCFEGTAEDLKRTYMQQMSILAVSLVSYELFKEKNIKIDILSGLSLGEYTCLYPAQVLDIKKLVYLIKERATAMEDASVAKPSCMFAVIGLTLSQLQEFGASEGFYPANINSGQQIAVSLAKENKQKIKGLLESKEARVIELDVGGGFHSIFMEPAKKHLEKVLQGLEFNEAKIPIVSNYTGRASLNKDEIKSNLINQLTSTVLWKDCVEYLAHTGVKSLFEVGPSKVLRGLIRKINPELKVINIEKKEDLDNLT